MLNSEAQGSTVFHLLSSADAADTAAATSDCVDISECEGHVVFIQNVGVVTAGTIDGKIQTGDESDGSDAADVSGATFTQCGTATDLTSEKITVDCNALGKYVRYVGTIATGPAQVAVVALAKKKYST